MIDKTRDEIWLSIWNPQASSIKDLIDKRVRQGIKVIPMLFSEPDNQLGITFHHDYIAPKIAEKRMGGRLAIVVRDKEKVLIFQFSP